MDRIEGEFDHINIHEFDAAFFAKKITEEWGKHRHNTQDVENPIWEYYEGSYVWFVQAVDLGIDTYLQVCSPSPAYGGATEQEIRELLGQSANKQSEYPPSKYSSLRHVYLNNLVKNVYSDVEKIIGEPLPDTDNLEIEDVWKEIYPRSRYAERLARFLELNFPLDTTESLYANLLHKIAKLDERTSRIEGSYQTIRNNISKAIIEGIEIGKELEFLRQRPREKAYITGWKNLDGISKANFEKASKYSNRNLSIFNKMGKLIKAGHTQSRSAEITIRKLKLGISAKQVIRIYKKFNS